MRRDIQFVFRLLVPVLALAGCAFPPFRITGNMYSVGTKGLANYFVVTPQGSTLINSDRLQGSKARMRHIKWTEP